MCGEGRERWKRRRLGAGGEGEAEGNRTLVSSPASDWFGLELSRKKVVDVSILLVFTFYFLYYYYIL